MPDNNKALGQIDGSQAIWKVTHDDNGEIFLALHYGGRSNKYRLTRSAHAIGMELLLHADLVKGD